MRILTRVLLTDFDEYKPVVANIIPPQRAAASARAAGLDDGKGWCSMHPRTFESTVHTGIHLLGDAIIASPMPKSAFSANNQAKVCAAAIVALLHGAQVAEPVLMNTCYSLVAPEYGISIAANLETIMPAYYKVEGLHRVLDRYRARPILTAQQIEDVIAYLLTLTD